MKWTRGRAPINVLLAVMIVALYIAISTPSAQSAISELYNSPVYRGHKKGTVALECAVSWNARMLPDVLRVLRDKDVKITFFVSGKWAQENQETLRDIVQAGHDIGTMGQFPYEDGDAAFLVEDIDRSIMVINEASGIKPTLYYSGMRQVANSSRAASRLDLTHVLCTVDILSGRGSAQDILSRALDKPFDGSILLMHPTQEALLALPACIDGLRQLGFEVGSVQDVLNE